MDYLMQWLGEQLDIDATRARETAAEYGAVWTAHPRMDSVSSDSGADVIDKPGAPLEHIAEHDPARVLREIEAKRILIAEHDREWCPHCMDDPNGCPTRRAWVLPYSHRPGYRDEWRS